MVGMKHEFEAPSEEALADKALYARLQRAAQAREDLETTVLVSTLVGTPRPAPKYVDGRWIL